MGIFQKKTGDFGSMFGRHKKEKMTSMENEDEKSLVSPAKTASRSQRKANRKNKSNAKFRRLRDEGVDPGTPKYEPPKGLDFPVVPLNQVQDGAGSGDPLVPEAIEVNGSASDTVSTLEGSLVDILRREQLKKKDLVKRFPVGGKQQASNGPDESNGWILDFTDKSFAENTDDKTHLQEKKPQKSSKKEKKIVEPKFYPLQDNPSSETSSKFEIPTFDQPFAPNSANIQFTCSEEYDDYENDENIEKVSSAGSDDFHQFVVAKMPPLPVKRPKETPKTKHQQSIAKAADSIAATLSSSSHQKAKNRMVAMDNSVKRSRKVLGETKTHQNATPTKNTYAGQRSVSSEPRQLHQSCSRQSNGRSVASGKSCTVPVVTSGNSLSHTASANSSDHSVLMAPTSSDDSLLKDVSEPKSVTEEPLFDESDPFHIGTFSQPGDSAWLSSSGESDQKTGSKQVGKSFDSGDDLISLIQRSSRQSEDEDSKKPDPSPRGSKQKCFFSVSVNSVKKTQTDETKHRSENKTGNNIVCEANEVSAHSREELIEGATPELEKLVGMKASHSKQHSFRPKRRKEDLDDGATPQSEKLLSKTASNPKQQSHWPKRRNADRDDDTTPKPENLNSKSASNFKQQVRALNHDDMNRDLLPSRSSSSGRSELKSNPSGVPTNAILGSMLFRHAHSESTMALPGERGRPSDPFDKDVHDMPLQLEIDMMEQQTVSSVTEDAGSFYHENFERWNNRAHRALNNLYSASLQHYHSAGANLKPYINGARDVVGQNKLFDA